MRRSWVGAMLLLAVLLAACGSDAKPNYSSVPASAAPTTAHTPPSSGSTSAAPSSTAASATPITTGPNVRPGEVPPTVPPAAQIHSPIGATYFAEYWMQALDWAYATTDSGLMRAALSDTCTDCVRVATYFDTVRNDGGYFSGGRISVNSAQIANNDDRNGAEQASDVTVDVTAIQTINGSGEVTGAEPDHPGVDFRVWTSWSGEAWKVVDWKRITG